MILMIDNYDSFTYNLVQYIGTITEDIKVERNDKITIDEIVHGKTSIINHYGSKIFKNVPKRFEATRYHSLVANKDNLPSSLKITAKTDNGLIMGLEHEEYPIYGVQFHPESIVTEYGMLMIENFIKE